MLKSYTHAQVLAFYVIALSNTLFRNGTKFWLQADLATRESYLVEKSSVNDSIKTKARLDDNFRSYWFIEQSAYTNSQIYMHTSKNLSDRLDLSYPFTVRPSIARLRIQPVRWKCWWFGRAMVCQMNALLMDRKSAHLAFPKSHYPKVLEQLALMVVYVLYIHT